MRRKGPPKLGGADTDQVLRAVANLVRWAMANGVRRAAYRKTFDPGSTDPVRVASVIASFHLHGAMMGACSEEPCRKAAVCKALWELLPGCPSPMTDPIRASAQAIFDAAGALKQVSSEIAPRLREAQQELDEELTRMARVSREERRWASRQLRRKGLPPLPPRKRKGPWGHLDAPHTHELLCVAPHAAAAEIQFLTHRLLLLDQALRATLSHPADQGPRTGGRPMDAPILCATWQLHAGGFKPLEVADLLAEPGDEADRIKRLRDRIRRLRQYVKRHRSIPWTVFSGESLVAQVRAR